MTETNVTEPEVAPAEEATTQNKTIFFKIVTADELAPFNVFKQDEDGAFYSLNPYVGGGDFYWMFDQDPEPDEIARNVKQLISNDLQKITSPEDLTGDGRLMPDKRGYHSPEPNVWLDKKDLEVSFKAIKADYNARKRKRPKTNVVIDDEEEEEET